MDWQKLSDQTVVWLLDKGVQILAIVVVTLLAKYLVYRIAVGIIQRTVVPTASPEAARRREETLIRIARLGINLTALAVSLMLVLDTIGVQIGPFLAAAGVAGVAVGFGGQYLIRDVIAGIFLIGEDQYRIGDYIRLGDVSGVVEDITLRVTTLRDLDGTVHHIPNGEIKFVSNYSKVFSRVNLDIGVAYDSDLDRVIEVINRVGKELAEDPEWKEDILEAPRFVRVQQFADSAILLKVLGDTKPTRHFDVAGEFRRRLKKAFDAEGIEIPFQQIVIHKAREDKQRKDEGTATTET
jgi:small conductance mechanosensitive channel